MASTDLFETSERKKRSGAEPLAFRMRPRTLDEIVGQEPILGEGKLLRRAIAAGRLSSVILYGPPGTGKTTLAEVIGRVTQARFQQINAVSSNVAELRKLLDAAKKQKQLDGKQTIIFIDEIHRFNRAQQDVLMPEVESGDVILIGATTLNPFFSIVSPLLSRSLVLEFRPLAEKDIVFILKTAVKDSERGLGRMKLKIGDDLLEHWAKVSDGDARRALNALEIAVLTTAPNKEGIIEITTAVAEESIQKKQVVYDREDDSHYDTISAFIKSMRGSDPDAALYWLAKMLYAGEDPRFIARRIVICAAEDVGNADPQALVVANAALQVSEFVGMPEARIPLAQAVVYIACAPKSNASYLGIERAWKDVEEGRLLEVPEHLRDASYHGAKKLGDGQGYKYAHDYEGHYVDQEYLKQKRKYYEPTENGQESAVKSRLKGLEGKKEETQK
ncbi:MAG: replication-associated recombination protein A [Candidatus Omnitrophica bacterium]|nr:replication-associated recombination protein A [Candidatus Omnitrophota bacterium]